MIGQPLERALRTHYLRQAESTAASTALGASIATIPDRFTPAGRFGLPILQRRYTLLLAAALLGALIVGAMAVGARLPHLPWMDARPAPAQFDPCALFDRALKRFGPGTGFVHSSHPDTSWSAAVCVNDGWDASWGDRHFIFRRVDTTPEQAAALIADRDNWTRFSDSDAPSVLDVRTWTLRGSGLWAGVPDPAAEVGSWVAVAVSADGYFFIVTEGNEADAYMIAAWVAAELDVTMPPGGPEPTPSAKRIFTP